MLLRKKTVMSSGGLVPARLNEMRPYRYSSTKSDEKNRFVAKFYAEGNAISAQLLRVLSFFQS